MHSGYFKKVKWAGPAFIFLLYKHHTVEIFYNTIMTFYF